MGCRNTKSAEVGDLPEKIPVESEPSQMGSTKPDGMVVKSQYKARLERLMCRAKESPEADFTLSECDLQTIPSGVFILCRVLRKEILDLKTNRLRSLDSGGSLSDLTLLTTLDLRDNLFKKLPEELVQLENLRALFLSNNLLERLPNSLNRLRKLEQLDLAHNKLTSIAPINCMPHLRLLDITANTCLRDLPMELSTCTGLAEILCTPETIHTPPPSVINRGTEYILRYLSGEAMDEHKVDGIKKTFAEISSVDRVDATFIENYIRQNTNVSSEIIKDEFVENTAAELELQRIQQQRRENLLQQLIQQQNDNLALVNKVQTDRDTERSKLITDIVRDEAISTLAVSKLLAIRTEPDQTLLEIEQQEQAVILERLRIQHTELRKHEVLNAMSNMLAGEQMQIYAYQQQRDATTREIMQIETDHNERLDRVVSDKERDRADATERIMQDEQLQINAVGSLIEQHDARSWALMEQVRLVEAELSRMTRIELDQKQKSADNRLTELSEQRLNLTYMLVDLMDQQEKRKAQLLETLHGMEEQKSNEEDYWLLQYQKLIDSRSGDHTKQAASLDPFFGYQLLVHGVVHCLPFLAKLLQGKNSDLNDITDHALLAGGVSSPADRSNILRAIEEYLRNNQSDHNRPASAPVDEPSAEQAETASHQEDGVLQSECVVCMERACNAIFLPCGHLCCCHSCQEPLLECPMCRAKIERRIKVIPS